MTTGWKLHVYSADEAAQRLESLPGAAGRRRSEPGSEKVNPQRRKQLLARAQETAADIRARP